MRFSALPSCDMDCCGASFVVDKLTDSHLEPLRFLKQKERSKMTRNSLLLCGTIATGEIFSFGGMLCLMSLHLTTLAKPFLIFSCVSSLRKSTAAGSYAERWAPRVMASMMRVGDQLSPQSTGQPSFA